MTEVTVKELADVVGIPVDRLLVQLGESGLPHTSAAQRVNDEQKAHLLSHLRRMHGKSGDDGEAPNKITLRRKSVNELKVSTQGRKRTITVEVRKRRTYVRTPGQEAANHQADSDSGEQLTRMAEVKRALQEEAKRRPAEQDEQLRREGERREQEAAQRKLREEEERKQEVIARAEAKALEAAAKAKPEAPAETAPEPSPVPPQTESGAAHKAGERKQERSPRKGRNKRKQEELHVTGAKSGRRRKKPKSRTIIRSAPTKHAFAMPTAPVVREVIIPETITVGELAQKMSIKVAELIKAMMNLGSMVTINQVIDQDTATVVVEELGHKAKQVKESSLEDEILIPDEGEHRDKLPRSPVVTIMGHVDHGKTSLLDYIRRTKVAAGEAGGITQHIGAYQVETEKGSLTFLDTPGHAAFTAMRARGAKATDLVVLVVAADDGVMPQTIEAVQHARAAAVPLLVAINKMDKADADPERIKQELSGHDVIPESWGGDTMFMNVSAIVGTGVDELLEAILLPVAAVLVQSGHLTKGDMLLAGHEYGRVRGLFDEHGREVAGAGPSQPVEVLGLSAPPEAGDEAVAVADEKKAREVALFRQGKYREVRLARQRASKLENVFEQMTEGDVSTLNIVLKADVQGSVEALREALGQLTGDEVKVTIVASGIGGLSETDINLAIASRAIVIGFNVRADAAARKLVETEQVDLHYFSVIYDVIDTVKQAISGLLSPEIREQIVGIAEVRDVFRSRKFGNIAGCMVKEGAVKRNNPIRVLRDNVVIYEGALESLKRFKDDATEVKSGTECGIGVRNYNDVKTGDQIEVFERVEMARTV